jgi:hypothetical protein
VSEPLLKDVFREQFATGGPQAMTDTINFWLCIIDGLETGSVAQTIMMDIFVDAMPIEVVSLFEGMPQFKPRFDYGKRKG